MIDIVFAFLAGGCIGGVAVLVYGHINSHTWEQMSDGTLHCTGCGKVKRQK